jgi:hypothetical protein
VLSCETVASRFLPAQLKLSSERAAALRELGYHKRDGHPNWSREVPITAHDLSALSSEIEHILSGVYGVDASQLAARLIHDDTEHPANPDLLDAMRTIAGDNSDPSKRHRLYNAMLNATFLVPLDPDADDAADSGDEFFVFERLSERPVFGVFTDWASLRAWKPRTWPYLPVHGSDLFAILVEQSLAGLNVNPDGRVGWQLFHHEVETLAGAVRDWKSRNLH